MPENLRDALIASASPDDTGRVQFDVRLPRWWTAFLASALASTALAGVPATAAADTIIDASGCPAPAFSASVIPGDPTVTSSDCTISFGSNTDVAGLRLYQADLSGAAMPGFADYGPASNWTLGTSTFGACLRAVGGGGVATWSLPGDATCTATDADPWQAIPSTASSAATIATTSGAGVTAATASVRFGGRVPVAQAPGAYAAALVFEVVAPNLDAPTNTVLPVVTGTATSGSTLTTDNGTWTGSPSSYAYQWRRCDAAGAACVDIGGATSSTYVLAPADVGSTIRSRVTATNASGSAAASSVQTAVITAAATGPTLDFIAGYEAGTLGTGASQPLLYGVATGSPLISAGYARTGSYGLGITAAGAAEHVAMPTAATATKVVRVPVRLSSLPVASSELFSLVGSSATFQVRFDAATSRITASIDGAVTVNGPVMVANNWDVVELRVSLSTTTATLDWTVDGVAQPPTTAAKAVGTIGSLQLGTPAAQTFNASFDDVAVSSLTADWPLGDGIVESLRPNAMGTHVNAASFQENGGLAIDAFSYDRVFETAMTVATSFIQQVATGVGDYIWTDFPTSTQTVEINGVRGLVSFHSAGAVANVARTELRRGDGSLAVTLHAGDMSGAALRHEAALVPAPGGGWTTAAIGGLHVRSGFWDGTGSIPYWDAFKLEVDVANVAPANSVPPSIVGTPSQYAYSTASDGTWTGTATITYARQWQLCDAAGNGCVDLAGRTGTTYAPRPSDVGGTLRIRVTATNTAGTTVVTSAASPVVQAVDCSTGPVVDPYAGPTVTPGLVNPGGWANGATGTWACGPTFTYEHVWSGTTLSTSINYRTRAADNNTCPTFRVTATTAQGTRSAATVYTIWDGMGGAMC